MRKVSAVSFAVKYFVQLNKKWSLAFAVKSGIGRTLFLVCLVDEVCWITSIASFFSWNTHNVSRAFKKLNAI